MVVSNSESVQVWFSTDACHGMARWNLHDWTLHCVKTVEVNMTFNDQYLMDTDTGMRVMFIAQNILGILLCHLFVCLHVCLFHCCLNTKPCH